MSTLPAGDAKPSPERPAPTPLQRVVSLRRAVQLSTGAVLWLALERGSVTLGAVVLAGAQGGSVTCAEPLLARLTERHFAFGASSRTWSTIDRRSSEPAGSSLPASIPLMHEFT